MKRLRNTFIIHKAAPACLAGLLLLGSCNFSPLAEPVPSEEPGEQNMPSSGPIPEDLPIEEEMIEDAFQFVDWIDWFDGEEEAFEDPEDIVIDLSVPQTFQITRPSKPEFTTTYDKYFITGTSNPELPLYLGEGEEQEEIERQGVLGVFGVLADLATGENTFVFTQGEDILKITITRFTPSDDIELTTVITQNSMFPPVQGGVKVGQDMPVSCIAPAGSTVQASFGGESVGLEQVVPGASEGVPAVFRGYIPVQGDYDKDITVNAGPVSYTLTFRDEITEYESSGNVYVAGENSAIALSISNYIGFVYPDTSDLSNFQEKLKRGATDYVKAQNNRYFELASGGFIPVAMAEILEGKVDIEDTVTAVTFLLEKKHETFIFHGAGTPAYQTRLVLPPQPEEETETDADAEPGTPLGEGIEGDATAPDSDATASTGEDASGSDHSGDAVSAPAGEQGAPSVGDDSVGLEEGALEDEEDFQEQPCFEFTLYNTGGTPPIFPLGSKLFEEVTAQAGETFVTYTFILKEEARLWGYNISYEDGDVCLQFRYKPYLSKDEMQPLKGVRILLDPGHGGEDAGAFGLPGSTGPAESDINLAHAYAVRNKLRELGAVVRLTRFGDDYFSLDERLEDIETYNADVFLSIHHNSVGEKSDANDISGMEIYYHDPLSIPLANALLDGLERGTDRKRRSVLQSYYRVTLLPYAPAVLMELGFMSNPLEYEKLVNTEEIERIADAIAEGMLILLEE